MLERSDAKFCVSTWRVSVGGILPAGVYNLRVTGWDGKEYVRRVVKK